MHVSSLSVDLHWFLQIVFTALVGALALRYLLRNTASKYFIVDSKSDPIDSSSSSFLSSSFSSSQTSFGVGSMPGAVGCAVCGKPTSKQCSRCKAVKYCSESCQSAHWRKEHKNTCKTLSASCRGATVLPPNGFRSVQKQVDKILFSYDEFVKLYNWDKPGLQPCGLLNCGNSCYANVVLQCLAHTRPLVAYLTDKGHRRECKRNEWCFLCELQIHLQRASLQQPFSPLNILSRLPSIGNNLGYGKQEDAHEFMRFAIDTMQSICLDEHGGEKLIHPKSQETTLIQHIFGGQLQSQVVCMQCNQISNQYENMMDLTVEMEGDVTSLEECLDQFTMKERLHGDNMYKCDGCNDYVKAWKCLTIRQAPNILTIALKRFQSGRFGKLNKRITFPENLNLSPYMSEEGDQTDKYKLYAVVVHVDMLNASYFGHYICYIKDFQGGWYRIDDCKVTRVELDHVLSQRAYMLLYSRMSARATCLKTFVAPKNLAELHKADIEPDQLCLERNVNSTNIVEQVSFCTSSHPPANDSTASSQSSTLVEGPTSPLSRDIQDNSESNITSQPFTKRSCLDYSCSQEIAPLFSTIVNHLASNGDSSDERREVRNPAQLPEPANGSEEIEFENHLPHSCCSGFSAPEVDESFVTLNDPGADSQMNGSCNVAACSNPPFRRDISCGSLSSLDSVVEHSGSERCQSQMENAEINVFVDRVSRVPAPAVLDEMSLGNDDQESEKCQPGTDVGVLETSGPSNPPVRRDISCGSLSSSDTVAEHSGSKRCQSQMENAEINIPVDRVSGVPAHAVLDEMSLGNDDQESEKCQPGIDVGVLETNGPCKLANVSHRPYGLYESASCVNNGQDVPSSSQKYYNSPLNMEVDTTGVNKIP